MGLGKTYSTKYLLDSNNNSGVAGQVLSTTSTGIDWADANTLPGAGLWLANGNDIYNSNSGNVGIGVTGPTGKLQVSLSSSTEYAMVQVPTGLTSADYNSGLVVGEGHANGSINMNFWTDTANNIGFIQVSTKNSDVKPLILNPIGGNVGIGTTGPGSKLDIANTLGNTKLTIQAGNPSSATGGSSIDIISRSSGSGTSPVSRIEGIFEDSNDSAIALSTTEGGTLAEKMRIFSNGNVNIGVAETGSSAVTGPFVVTHSSSRFLTSSFEEGTVSLSAKNNNNNLESLRIAGDSIKFFNGTNAVGSQKMVILSSGNVGIGTTGPARLLSLEDGAGGGDPTDSRTKLYINASTEAYMSFNVPANQYMGIRYAIAGTNKAFMEFEDPNNYLRIGTVSADSIVFATSNQTKMVILPGGNVGIGTTGPNELLHILGSNATALIQGSGTSSTAGVDFFPRDVSNVAHLQSIKGVSGNLTFLTGGTPGNSYVPTERMRIDSSGQARIGIGGKKTSIGSDVTPTTVLTVFDIQDTSSYSGINIKQYNDPFDNQGFFGMINCVGGSFNIVAKSTGTIKFMDGQSSATNMEISGTGDIKFNNYDSTNNTGTPTYLLGTDASGNVVKTLSSSAPGSLWAASGNNIYNTNSDNVGIGVSSPRGKLQINGNGNAWNDAPSVRLWDTTNSKGWLVGNVNNYTAGDFYIRTFASVNADPTSASQEFTIKHATGNVGIGTTTPDAKLEVEKTTNGSFYSVFVKNTDGGSSAFVSKKWLNDDAGFGEIWRNSSTRSSGGQAASSFNMYNSADMNFWSGGSHTMALVQEQRWNRDNLTCC